MRELADSTRIERFMSELGRAVQVEGRVYFTGGATAVLHGGERPPSTSTSS